MLLSHHKFTPSIKQWENFFFVQAFYDFKRLKLYFSLDVSTYFRRCPQCHMMYRYQEWQDSLHNFDDHVILKIELCLYLRLNLQVSTMELS